MKSYNYFGWALLTNYVDREGYFDGMLFSSQRSNGGSVDTGHFFNTSLIQGLVFKGIVKGQESKVWAFFKDLRSRIEKMTKTPSFLGQKLKLG